MTEARVTTNRRTQRLEQVEASATQVESMVARERDELYEQLMQALRSNPIGAQPSSVPAAPQAPASAAGSTTTPQTPQTQTAPAPSQVQQPAHQPQAPTPMQPPIGANPFAGGPQGSSGNPLEPPRQPAPGTAQSINPITGMSGMGYGFDPPTPLQTPGTLSQGTLSQHFNIATPPPSAGRVLANQGVGNPLQDPLAEADPWAGTGPQSATPGVTGHGGHSDETGA
eukprot:288191-Amphidinium_carterae.1